MARLSPRRGTPTGTPAGTPSHDDHTPPASLASTPAPATEGAALSAAPAARRIRLPRTFSSFSNRDFRWFYASMLGQMAAQNMQLVIRGLLAYVLTGSYAAVGLIGLAGAIPSFLLSMFGGVVADRVPKRTVLQCGQAASLVNAIGLAALEFTGLMSIEWLLASAAAQGVVMALMQPSRQAMIPDVVGGDQLMNAVSLNMAGMNTMRLFAPALGGAIVGIFGFGWAFTTMALLFVVALIGMAQVTRRPATAPGTRQHGLRAVGTSAFSDIAGGLAYTARDRRMMVVLSLAFVTALLGMPLQFLLPAYVADFFTDDAQRAASMAGVMLSVSSVGALTGALVLATIPNRNRGWLLMAGAGIVGLGLLLFTLASGYWLAAAFLMVYGLGSSMRMALAQGLLHTYVENAYRGRVMAVFMTQMSMMQFGTFIVGALAEVIGIRTVLAALGVLLMLSAATAATFSPTLRRMQ